MKYLSWTLFIISAIVEIPHWQVSSIINIINVSDWNGPVIQKWVVQLVMWSHYEAPLTVSKIGKMLPSCKIYRDRKVTTPMQYFRYIWFKNMPLSGPIFILRFWAHLSTTNSWAFILCEGTFETDLSNTSLISMVVKWTQMKKITYSTF